ncbi:MAG: YciI family protein [Chloroflexi bacterium]|nr:YciI family protein [Chloroflexota bacterium]
MRFALLIYSTEADRSNLSEQDVRQNLGEWFAYTEDLQKSGKMLAGDALMPVSTAHTVRIQAGQATVTDGPFAETKEQFGGFYIVEANSWEEAAESAKKMPIVEGGSVEVRPLMEFEQS